MEMQRCNDGAVVVSDGDTVLSPFLFYVRIIDQASIVQIGNGMQWTAWSHLAQVNESHQAVVGDYEITVKRVRPKSVIVNRDGIIKINETRRLRRLSMKQVREEGR